MTCVILNSAVENVFKRRKKALSQGLICSGSTCKNENAATALFNQFERI